MIMSTAPSFPSQHWASLVPADGQMFGPELDVKKNF